MVTKKKGENGGRQERLNGLPGLPARTKYNRLYVVRRKTSRARLEGVTLAEIASPSI